MINRGGRRPNPVRIWLERRRFRKLSGAPPRRPRGARPKGAGFRERFEARRGVRKAAALPRYPRPNAFRRWVTRRQIRASQPAWSTKPPKPRVPIKDRISSALYRPKPLRPERPALRERLAARAAIKSEGPRATPRAPVFRGRNEKVIGGVVAASVLFLLVTFFLSKTPVPTSQAQGVTLSQQPQAPDNPVLDSYTPPPPPKVTKSSAAPTTPASHTTTTGYVPPPTTTHPPPTTTNPPPTTTKPPPTTTLPPPTTTTPPPTTTPPTTTPPTTTPPTDTTTPPSPGQGGALVSGVTAHPVPSMAGVLLLLLVGTALARLRSHPA